MPWCKHGKWHSECVLCSLQEQEESRLGVERICSRCGRDKNVHRNDKSGELICKDCFHKDPANHEECSGCGKRRRVVTRDESDGAICHVCYNQMNVGTCAKCGETKVIQALKLCSSCYHQRRIAKAKMAARPA